MKFNKEDIEWIGFAQGMSTFIAMIVLAGWLALPVPLITICSLLMFIPFLAINRLLFQKLYDWLEINTDG